MRKQLLLTLIFFVGFAILGWSQTIEGIVSTIKKEEMENSQLEELAYQLTELIEPGLADTSEMKSTDDWAIKTYKKCGITAEFINLLSVEGSVAFIQWLPNVKEKMVMVSRMQHTGRPNPNWGKFAI
ncbi:hypothetical protein ACOCEA_03055 [Maribacter sp. CXY002]|uniref:hypothetical protein n=1 Tax=Maribacter luteocoastalis TaxID=3407671 RepID=UPI003B6858BD